MEKQAFLVIVFSLASAIPSAGEDATKKDAERIKGQWTAVALIDAEGQAKPVAEDDPKHFLLEFTAGKVTTKLKKRSLEGTYKLDPSKSPKEIDIVRRRGDEDVVFKGIYAVEENRLKVCLAGTGNERPKDFKQAKGIEFAVELKRVKE